MSIHVPRRGSKRSWVAIWALVVLGVVVAATNCFGLAPVTY